MDWSAQFEHLLQAAQTALSVSAILLLPGIAWAWRFSSGSVWNRLPLAVSIGLSAVLVAAILLAEIGLFSLHSLILAAGAITVLGVKRHGGNVAHGWGRAFLVFTAVLFLLLLLPPRGEWMIGGWDPGVNVNQGLLISRTGGVWQAPDPLMAEALRVAPEAIARKSFDFMEALPGVPVDPTTGAYRPYFYRATPTWIALLDQLAGRAAAIRGNEILACIAAVLFAGLLHAAGVRSRGLAIGAGVLLLLHPLVVAHHGDPASEMLELALVCGAGLLLSRERDCPHSILLFMLMLLGALNRVSFLIHLSMLLAILSLWDAPEENRSSVAIRHLAVAAALAAGFAWYTWVTPESLVKVRHLLPATQIAAAGSVGLAFALHGGLAVCRSANMPVLSRVRRMLRPMALLIPAILMIREIPRMDAWEQFLRNVPAWFRYAPPVLACVGLMGLVWRGAISRAVPWLLWLSSALLAVWLHRHAAELYPWATKRWLAWSPPLLLTGACFLVDFLATRLGRSGRTAGFALAAAICVSLIAPSRAAWLAAEHRGSRRAVEELAAHLRPDDIVVADHFRWATPLALAMGLTTLNAEPMLHGRGNPEALARVLSNRGRRIVLLTSTEAGIDTWPDPFRTARSLIDPLKVETRERIQHRSNRGYSTRERIYTLRLFEWEVAP